MKKTCVVCSKEKLLEDFSKCTKSPDGRGSYCRLCHRAYTKQWRLSNLDHVKEVRKKYEQENKELVRERSRSWRRRNKTKQRALNKAFYLANPERNLYYDAKKRAKRFCVPFSITHKNIFIPDVCPVFGIKLVRGNGQLTDASPTLDRIIPNLGYVVGNIRVISHRANRLKSDATPAELRAVADWIERELTKHQPQPVV